MSRRPAAPDDHPAELAALARALGFGDLADGGEPPALSVSLVDRAIAEQVAPLLADRWQRGLVRVDDPPALARLTRERLAAAGLDLAIERGAAPLVEALEHRRVPALALKGRALVATVYRDGALRPRVDTDLLVPAGRWDEALATAAEAGFTVVVSPGRELTLRRYHETHLRGAADTLVDLHRAVCAWPLFAVDHDGLFARAVRADLDQVADAGAVGANASRSGGTIEPRVPEASDLFLLLALNAAQDGFHVPFRAVVDALALARRPESDGPTGRPDPTAVVARARRWRAVRATAIWLRALLRFGLDRARWEPAADELDPRRRASRAAAEVPRGHHGSLAARRWRLRRHLAQALDGVLRPAVFFAYRGLLWAGDVVWSLPRRAFGGGEERCAPSAS